MASNEAQATHLFFNARRRARECQGVAAVRRLPSTSSGHLELSFRDPIYSHELVPTYLSGIPFVFGRFDESLDDSVAQGNPDHVTTCPKPLDNRRFATC